MKVWQVFMWTLTECSSSVCEADICGKTKGATLIWTYYSARGYLTNRDGTKNTEVHRGLRGVNRELWRLIGDRLLEDACPVAVHLHHTWWRLKNALLEAIARNTHVNHLARAWCSKKHSVNPLVIDEVTTGGYIDRNGRFVTRYVASTCTHPLKYSSGEIWAH